MKAPAHLSLHQMHQQDLHFLLFYDCTPVPRTCFCHVADTTTCWEEYGVTQSARECPRRKVHLNISTNPSSETYGRHVVVTDEISTAERSLQLCPVSSASVVSLQHARTPKARSAYWRLSIIKRFATILILSVTTATPEQT